MESCTLKWLRGVSVALRCSGAYDRGVLYLFFGQLTAQYAARGYVTVIWVGNGSVAFLSHL